MAKPTIYDTLTKFRKALDELLDDYDFEATEKCRRYSFAMKSGTTIVCKDAKEMFRKLNQRFGKFIDLDNSKAVERKFIITYLDEPSLKQDSVSTTEE